MACRSADQPRRIQRKHGDPVRGQADVDRTNQSLNAVHRDNLSAIIELLDNELKGLELSPPRLDTPYQFQEVAEIRRDAEFISGRLEEAKKVEHTYFRMTRFGF